MSLKSDSTILLERKKNTKKLKSKLAEVKKEAQALEIENQKLKQRLEKFKNIDLYPFNNSKIK